jgi:RNA recognition motif-containing protein
MILFIGNLNKLTTEKEIQTLFAGFGVIDKLRLMMDKITRRSRGFAYISMPESNEALNAIRILNSSAFSGSWIIVGEASSQQMKTIDWN